MIIWAKSNGLLSTDSNCLASSQLVTSIHWSFYCIVRVNVVIHFRARMWKRMYAVFLSFIDICIVIRDALSRGTGWDLRYIINKLLILKDKYQSQTTHGLETIIQNTVYIVTTVCYQKTKLYITPCILTFYIRISLLYWYIVTVDVLVVNIADVTYIQQQYV